MIQMLFTFLVGLIAMILFILWVVFVGWVAEELSEGSAPYWAQGFVAVMIVIVIIAGAYKLGQCILGA